MSVAVVLFTRDLRVRDHPALHAAVREADRVVPLFVRDPAVRSSPNRDRFLDGCLADLRTSLRERGGDLFVRRGDPVAEAVRIARATGAETVYCSADVSAFAARRQRALGETGLALRTYDGITVVPPGALRPTSGGDHYKVFTPYWRAWQQYPVRSPLPAPRRVTLPDGLSPSEPLAGSRGGETAARRRLAAWRSRVSGYADRRDDLAANATSGLSPYLHFGCVSPATVASTVDSDAFVRQLCWRDFYHQILAAFPRLGTEAYSPAAVERWREDPDALDAWQQGRTGVPIVDAGMRQLMAEGLMHNRARMITAAFLTKALGLDWREGAAWYARWLLDADVANNNGNWQWVAGTGTDTRPYRRFNPIRQAHRFDPDGAYVRRWVPELAGIDGGAVHEPWRLTAKYPPPIAGVVP